MRKSHLAIGCTLLAAVTGAWPGVGKAQQGVGERVGESLDDAGKAIKRGVQRSGEAVRESFARTKTSVQNMGIEARVYGRLHWDKELNGSSIELEVRNASEAIIRGSVPTAAMKAKAVALTRDTVGVTRVIDELTISAPAREIPGTSRVKDSSRESDPLATPRNPASKP